MYPLLITREDFPAVVEITPSVTADDVRTAIRDAHDLDLSTLGLPLGLVAQLGTLLPLAAPADWAASADYTTGDRVSYGQLVWEAVQGNTGQMPPVPAPGRKAMANDFWAPVVLPTLYCLHLRPWLVAQAWGYYLTSAGVDATAQGLVVKTDPNGTFNPVSETGRGRMIATNARRADVYQARLRAFLHLYATELGITPTTSAGSAPARRGGIRTWTR